MRFEREPDFKSLGEKLPFLGALDAKTREQLLKLSVVNKHPKRTKLFSQDEKAETLYMVLNGWVKLFNLTAEGDEIVVGMVSAGDIVCDVTIFDNGNYPYSAVVVDDVQTLEFPIQLLRDQAKYNHELVIKVALMMTNKINKLFVRNAHLANMNAQQRLSCLLLRLSSWMKGEGGTFTLPYDKSIIATQLGVEPATLSRVFGKLEELGVKRNGSEVSVRNFSDLSASCCLHCPVPEGKCAGRRLKTGMTGIGAIREEG